MAAISGPPVLAESSTRVFSVNPSAPSTRVDVNTCAWWFLWSPSRCGAWIATSAATP